MRICAEALFALNALLDTGLLACSARICGAQLSWKRLAAGGVFGGMYAVAALLPGAAFLQHGMIRLSVMAAMGLIAFGGQAKLLRLLVWFFGCACGFAGVVFAMVQLTGTGLLHLPGGSYYPVSALALLSLGAVCMAVCRLMFSGCAQHTARTLREVTVCLNGRRQRIRTLLDTGNTLKDPMTGEPVLVADWHLAARLLPQIMLQGEEFCDAPELMQRLSGVLPGVRFRLIPYRAVGVAQGLLLAVRCEMEESRGKRRPLLVAFSPTPVSGSGEYEGLTGGAA